MAQSTEELDEASKKFDDDWYEYYSRGEIHRMKKHDLETNHPQKLYRTLKDLKPEMLARGYEHGAFNDPKLERSMEGVAAFDGNIEFLKMVKFYSTAKIIAGIIVAIFGGVLMLGSAFTPVLAFFGVAVIIAGIIILLNKSKTILSIEIRLEGESYEYRGQKETHLSDVEIRVRADVVSDLRLTLLGIRTNNSKKAKEILLSDLAFLENKLNKIVPEFKVPIVKKDTHKE